MYYVVTGAAGFIGSNIVKALNERGITNIIAVDNLTKADKFNAGPRKNIVQQVRRDLVAFGDRVRVEAFSSLKGVGIDRLAEVLTEWYFADAAAELESSDD